MCRIRPRMPRCCARSRQGLLVTEYPPGERPARHRFLTRNRLVAALAGATVVVEAGARSGAANTAAWARALGRSVCAVPGPVTSSVSVGCHALLRAGAHVVTRAEDVVELIGHVGELAPDEQRPVSVLDGLADTDKRVYDALPARGSRTADEIAVAAGLPPTQVLGPLAVLELAGLVVRREGRWKLRQLGSRPALRLRSYSRRGEQSTGGTVAGRPVHTFEVVRTEQVTPHLTRVVLGGDGFDTFTPNDSTDAYVKIVFVRRRYRRRRPAAAADAGQFQDPAS